MCPWEGRGICMILSPPWLCLAAFNDKIMTLLPCQLNCGFCAEAVISGDVFFWHKPSHLAETRKNAQSPSDLWTVLTWHVLELVTWTWKSWFSLTNYPLEPSTISYTHDYQPSFSRQGPDSKGRLNALFSNNALKAEYNSIKHFTHEGQSQFHSVEKNKTKQSIGGTSSHKEHLLRFERRVIFSLWGERTHM